MIGRFLAIATGSMLLVCGGAAYAQSSPNDYEAAVAARQGGHPAEAKRLLTAWLAKHPDDVDAMLQLAEANLALGNLDAAQAGFAEVLRRAPDYADAREGLAAVAARRSAARETRHGLVAIQGAVSTLSGAASDWNEVSGQLEVPVGRTATVGASASWYRRFGVEDVEIVGQATAHPSENLWLRGHVGGTPQADFRPELEAGAGVDFRLQPGDRTVYSFDAGWQRFPLQTVVTFSPGIVRYLAEGSAWLTLRGIGTVAEGGPLQLGGSLRGDYVPKENYRLFAGIANGPDTDLGRVTRVTSLFGGMEVPLANRLSLTGSIGRDWREGGPDRTEFRVGLKAPF